MADKPKIPDTVKAKAKEIVDNLLPRIDNKFVIAIAGETGSGKTTLALALADAFQEQGITPVIIHQDDYFFLPPKDNEKKRKQDIAWVGTSEVNLELMAKHINAFRAGKKIVKPSVIYEQNRFVDQELDTANADVLLVEGTYVLNLPSVDYKIFLAATYNETLQRRIERARDNIDDFLDKVLEIEHRIISKQKDLADLVI